MRRASLVNGDVDPALVLSAVRDSRFGAVSIFVGTVRDTNEGRRVRGIDYSAYVEMAQAEMDQILSEAEERFGVRSIAVEHRLGSLKVGDVSIAIAAAHEHRAPALDATRFVIEQVKLRVPIWKLEQYDDGVSEWVDPTRQSGVTRA